MTSAPVAIIGLGLRLPQADDLSTFWKALANRQRLIRTAPPQRWDATASGLQASRVHGGFLDEADGFDASFFGISPREANLMDPQQRFALEMAWHAIEDAGYAAPDLAGTRTGVFMGVCHWDYAELLEKETAELDAYQPTGIALSAIANRISYHFDFHGPSIANDTACASSLTAIYEAVRAIQAGDCAMALAGGVNLCWSPNHFIAFAKAGMLSKDGASKAFDAGANGYVRGEGGAVFLLKPLDHALRDGDPIHAVIRAVRVNHGGRTNSLTVTNPDVQADLILETVESAGIPPDSISYVEAHGPGTPLGDPIEIAGLKTAFARLSNGAAAEAGCCAIGSVKANIGHLEGAAAAAGLAKIIAAFHAETLPGHASFERLNPLIDFSGSPFRIQEETESWVPPPGSPRRAGLSSFGFAGSNGHIIVEEGPRLAGEVEPGHCIIPLSARNDAQLRVLVGTLLRFIEDAPGVRLPDLALTLQRGRVAMEARAAFSASSLTELKDAARAYLEGRDDPGIINPDSAAGAAAAWLKGQPAGWPEMPGARRIHAPLYPFARQRFWFDRTRAGKDQARVPHPLLHRNRSGLDAIVFESHFRGDEFFFAEHAAAGQQILPGTVALEMVRAAASLRGAASDANAPLHLTDVTWIRPIAHRPEGVDVTLRMERGPPGGLTFTITANGAEPAVRGKFHAGAGAAPPAPLPAPSATTPCEPAEIYRRLRATGMEHGPAFRLIRAVQSDGGTASIGLQLGRLQADTLNAMTLHPLLLDAAIQGWTTVQQELAGGAAVPFSCRELHVLAPCTAKMTATVRNGSAEQAARSYILLDIDLRDDTGRLCIAMRGLMLRRVANAAAAAAPQPEDGKLALFRGAWRAFPRHSGDAFQGAKVLLAGFTPDEAALLHKGLAAPVDLLVPDEGLAAGAASLFDTCARHVTAAMKAGGATPMLVVAHPDLPAPAAAPLAALLRTAAAEQPRFAGSLLRFTAGCDMAEVARSVAAELDRDDLASEILYDRDGARRAFMHEPAADVPPQDIALDPVAAYWVTGGMGGVGLHLAQWLASKGARHIVLSGRSAEPGAKARAIFAALASSGVSVTCLACDVTDSAAVHGALLEIERDAGPLRGLIHAAGILDDALLLSREEAKTARVLEPKLRGTEILDAATQATALDFFILISSIAGSFGNPGQTDYSGANAFLDGFAEWREEQRKGGKRHGRSLAVAWPLWADAGMTVSPKGLEALTRRFGTEPLPADAAFHALDQALALTEPRLLVHYGDRNVFARLLQPQRKARAQAQGQPRREASGSRQAAMVALVRDMLGAQLRIEPADIRTDRPLVEYGLDSIAIVETTTRLEERLGELPKTLFFEHVDIDGVASYLAEHHGGALEAAAEPEAPPIAFTPEPDAVHAGRAPGNSHAIAIVGMSLRVAKAQDVDAFWAMLSQGQHGFTVVPHDRWDHGAIYHPERDVPGKTVVRTGAFLDGIDMFDPRYFRISQREAELMAPEVRLFLQASVEAFESAGYSRETLHRKFNADVAVIASSMTNEYDLYGFQNMLVRGAPASGSYTGTLPNMVSYFYGLTGPSYFLDTMCSAASTCVHEAVHMLRSGRCAMALAGAVNLLLHPQKLIATSQEHFTSKSADVIRGYGLGADGTILGEGVGALVLKRLEDAERDNDTILGVIIGTGISNAGVRNGFTVPNPHQQAAAIEAAFEDASIDPRSIAYVEGHGSGTSLGDPIEVRALSQVWQKHGAGLQECPLGTVKGNVAHLLGASGLAGLVKVLLQLKHGELAPSLHADTLNPNIPFAQTPFYVQRERGAWPQRRDAQGRLLLARAGVTSIGAGGMNAHIIIEAYAARARPPAGDRPQVFCFSALAPKSLRALIERMRSAITSPGAPAADDVAYTLQVGRNALPCRLAVTATSLAELAEQLGGFLSTGASGPGIVHVENTLTTKPWPESRIADALAVGDLAALARAWAEGTGIDWELLPRARAPRRIALPAYPFEQVRCWYPSFDDAPSVTSPLGSALKLHPLVGRNVSDISGLRFETRIILDELLDYSLERGRGRELLSTIALELPLAAARCAGLSGPHEVSGLLIEDSLPAQPWDSLEFIVTPKAEGVTVSVSVGAAGTSTPWLAAEVSACAAPRAAEIPAGAVAGDPQPLYTALRSRGLSFAPFLECLSGIWRAPGIAFGQLRLDGPQQDHHKKNVSLPPQVLAVIAQLILAEDEDAETAAVAGCDRLAWSGGAASSIIMHRREQGVYDVSGLDDTGAASWTIQGLRTRAAAKSHHAPQAPSREASSVASGTVGKLRAIAAELLKFPVAEIDPHALFHELGFDSISLARYATEIGAAFGIALSPAAFFEFGSIDALARHLGEREAAPRRAEPSSLPRPAIREAEAPKPQAPIAADPSEIAIIGMAGRFPGAPDVDSFFKLLLAGADLTGPLPLERYGDDYRKRFETAGFRLHGGFLTDVDRFDAAFFRISPYEAERMDPQQRLLLETTWRALEDAGYRPDELPEGTGVFAGVSAMDYAALLAAHGVPADGQVATGNSLAMVANRLSYALDVNGPSESIDTACSSSLVALLRASDAVRSGKCPVAIVGGVHLALSFEGFEGPQRAGMLGASGRCQSFGAAADGYARGEGVVTLLIKPRRDAERDGDRILALIAGGAENHGGRAGALTAPNVKAQSALIRAACADLDLTGLGMIEAHGTGTPLGDPVEFNALKAALAELPEGSVALGSVKSNIGHLEAAAGLAGVVKAVEALRHQRIPPTLHATPMNPLLELAGTPFRLATAESGWPQSHDRAGRPVPRMAGVSSFGFGGANAHVVLREAAPQAEPRRAPLPARDFAATRFWIPGLTRPQPLLFVPAWTPAAPASASSRPAMRHVMLGGFEATGLQADAVHRLPHVEGPGFDRALRSAQWMAEQLSAIMRKAGSTPQLVQWVSPAGRDDDVAAGLAAMLRTAALEDHRIIPQIHRIEGHISAASLQALLAREAASSAPCEVLHQDGMRKQRSWQEFPVSRASPAVCAGHVILVTGALGGLGRLIAQAIASGGKPAALVLTGRRSLTGPDEIWLEGLRASAPETHYMRCDVARQDEADALATMLRSRWGRVDIVVHAAGVLEDKILTGQPRDGIARVFAPKVEGAQRLMTALRSLAPRDIVLFSSIAAIAGNVGQAAYAAANACLAARVADASLPVRVIHWPLWRDGGMGVDQATALSLARRMGQAPLQTADGLAVLWSVLETSLPECAVMAGDAPLIRAFFNDTFADPDTSREIAPRQADAALATRVAERLGGVLAEVVGLSASAIDPQAPLADYGIDSLMIVRINERLERDFGRLPRALLFQHCTVSELASHLLEIRREAAAAWVGGDAPQLQPPTAPALQATPARSPARQDSGHEPIAIIGLSASLPGADSLEAFWQLLLAGADAISEIPAERWPLDGFYDPDPARAAASGKSYSKWGGFLPAFADFDPAFFRIAPREAASMDPQERQFLMRAWEALEDAGYSRTRIAAKLSGRVGVYAGVTKTGYAKLAPFAIEGGAMAQPGISFASVANRVSHILGLSGPSLPVDTMCSSSLTAIHLACEHLRNRACDMAIAGGVNLYLHPSSYVELSAARMLSPTGQCHTFGDGADGFVPGEGAGCIILKPLSRALADGDRIHAVIRGSAINHGGTSNGYTVPNPDAQREVVRAALADAGVMPGEISYVETHGTGTRLGDPIEIESLAAALKDRPQDAPRCHIASVKTNIGHLEAAAGLAGLVKILLQMRHGTIAPHRNATAINPHIDLAATPFSIPHTPQPWLAERRIAGLSSFGAGGANAHLVIEDWQETRQAAADDGGPQAVILSGRDPGRLKEQARALLAALGNAGPASPSTVPGGGEVTLAIAGILGVTPGDVGEADTLADLGFDTAQLARLRQWLRDQGRPADGLTPDTAVAVLAGPVDVSPRSALRLADIAYTLQVGREAMPERLAIEAHSVAHLAAALEAFIAGRPHPSVWTGNAEAHGAILNLLGDELRAPLTAAMVSGSLSKMLRLWVAGAPVDWEALHRPQRPGIISLPTYPFARLRLWPAPARAETAEDIFPEPSGRDVLAAQDATLEAEIACLLAALLPETADGVQPRYHRWLEAARGLARPPAGERPSHAAAWQRWRAFRDSAAQGPLAAQSRLADTTLSALGDILSGRRAATAVMFPAGGMDLVEAVYVDNPVAARFSEGLALAASDAARRLAAAHPARQLHILEVGAGTGGTTAPVLAALAPHAGAIARYCFTDLSRAFLTRAEQRFAQAVPFLTTALFDAERAPEAQQIAAGSWDIVIAANVLHATRDIVATLKNVRSLLSEDGVLLLNETAKATAFTHVTFGLLDGWWAHRDTARRIPGTPSLTPAAWRAALEEAGFAWLAGSSEAETDLGQQLIAARAVALPQMPVAITTPPGVKQPVREVIRRELAAVLGVMPETIGLRSPISDLGLDSILGMQFVHRINQALNTALAQTELYDHATVEALEARLAGEAQIPAVTAAPPSSTPVAPAAPTPVAKPVKEPIAIIGLSGRFAKSDTPEELWQHLIAGRDLVEPVTRFDLAAEYPGADPASYGRHGSFIDGIENFDAAFFGITGVEATYMDPQQRLFLEEAWRTLENAGYAGEETSGARVGVFVGCSHGDYQDMFREQPPGPAFWGNTISLVPARIAYYLNLKGPAVAVDTACSSSLVAIHLACQSLWNGDSGMAIAGGVFVNTTPRFFRYANQARMLSASGRCAAFGAAADGIVPGEAVAAVLLKPLSAARADGDTIHAVIEAIGVNQDGATNGISAPSAVSQERLIRETYESSGISAADISLVEAHGTGTPLGDPIEFAALSRAYASMTDKQGYCALGSIKSNIGHATTAAGIAGLVKVLLALRHEAIPPTIHCAVPNPAIRAKDSPFIFNAAPLAWPGGKAVRRAAISSFGFSGTNAHLVLRDEPQASRGNVGGPAAIFLSARSEERLRVMARALADHLVQHPQTSLRDAAFTLASGRRHMRHRLALVTDSIPALTAVLARFAASGEPSAGLRLSELQDGAAPGAERLAQGLNLIETLRRDDAAATRENWDQLANLYCEGAELPFGRAFAPGTAGHVPLPSYPFERRRYWVSPPAAAAKPTLTLKTSVTTTENEVPPRAPDGRLRLTPKAAYSGAAPPDMTIEDGVALLRTDGSRTAQTLEAAARREDVRVILIEASAEAVGAMGATLDRVPLPLVLATPASCPSVESAAHFHLSGPGVLAEARELARNIARAPRGSLIELKACLRATPLAPEQQDERLAFPASLDDQALTAMQDIPIGSGVVSLAISAEGVAIISLSERQHRNMFTPEFMAGLAAAFEAVDRSTDAKAVILTGFDGYFACGGTREGLEELQRGEKRFTDIRAYTLPLDCRLPVIAAMQGHAIGAGWSLGLYCDAQIYAQEAIYHSNYLRLGFTPGAGATLAFPHRLGLALGSEILLSAREYRGKELAARHPGLHVRPAGEVLSAARAIARHWARHPRAALLAAKQRSAAWLRERIEAALARELDMHARTFIGNAEVKSRIAQAFASTAAQPLLPAAAPDAAVRKTVLATLTEELMIGPGDIRDASGFLELGLDSILAVTWLRRLGKELQREIPATAVYAHPTVGALIAALSDMRPPPAPQPETPAQATPRADIRALVTRTLAEELMIEAASIRDGSGFLELGLDSILALTWLRRLSRDMGTDLPATAVYAHPTVGALVAWLSGLAPAAASEAVAAAEPPPVPLSAPAVITAAPAQPNAIAIIGASGRFPMARNLEAFWSNIASGRDCITEVPRSRWDISRHYHPDPTHPETSYSKWMGAIDDVDMFDARFFNITPREAELMDPQQRLFLEHAWQAFEDGALDPARLQGSNCGIFVGAGPSGYASLIREKNAYSLLGSSGSILAARIAHLLDLQGPAVSLDTACSSSLVAIVEACDSLTLGNCDMALAGGACVMIGPSMFVDTSKVNMLSPDGRCFTFDSRANGFVPGEGVGVLLLKRLADAERDGDPVRAVIRGWGTNQDGRTNGITAPNPKAQARLIRRVHERFGIAPESIGLIEAHGTGTALGDPIEIEGLTEAFAVGLMETGSCAIGSVKSNIGHLLASAGVAGAIKAMQALEHRQLPPTIHFETLNAHIRLDGTPFRVNTGLRDWPQGPAPRRACVSAFGFSGTNAHIVLEEAPPLSHSGDETAGPLVIPVSAANAGRLAATAAALADALRRNTAISAADAAVTLQAGRPELTARAAAICSSRAEVIAALDHLAAGKPEGTWLSTTTAQDAPSVAAARDGGALRRLAQQWVSGGTVTWPESPGGRRRHLPTYPFERVRHWVAEEAAAAAPAGAFDAAQITPDGLSLEIAGGEPWLAGRVTEEEVFPLGLFLPELARRLAENSGAEPKVLRHLVWGAPFGVNGRRRTIDVRLEESTDSLRYAVTERTTDCLWHVGEMLAGGPMTAEGWSLPPDRAGTDQTDQWRAFAERCAVHSGPPAPEATTVLAVARHARGLTASLRRWRGAGAGAIDAFCLETVWRLVTFLMTPEGDGKLLFPHAVGRLGLLAPIPDDASVIIERSDSPNGPLLSIAIADSAGSPSLVMDGVMVCALEDLPALQTDEEPA